MARWRPEFRKSWRFFHLFRFTVSKGGFSFGAKLGPISKSWGTRENRTTIDGPGHFGLEMRKVDRHKAHEHGEKGHALTVLLLIVVVAGELLLLLGRIHLHPFSHCRITGHPDRSLLVLFAGEAAILALLWHALPRLRGLLFVALALAFAYLQWHLYGTHISPDLLCHK